VELQAVYSEAEQRSAARADFVFLGHLFDNVKEPIYIDWAHLGPRGNEIIASAIADRLLPLLPKSAPESPIPQIRPENRAH
jgi:hypothetical protein